MVERDGDGFIDRWSRRKRGDDLAGPAEGSTAETEVPPAAPIEPSGGRSGPPSARAQVASREPDDTGQGDDSGDPEVIAKLPDLDNVDEDTDFSAFLQDGVPEALRRQALRRLWRLNPVLANLDGLNDYDENYSLLGMVTEQVQSLYQAGKGYLDPDEDETDVEADDEIPDDSEISDHEAVAESESDAAPEPELEPESEHSESREPVDSVQTSQSASEPEPEMGAPGDPKPESMKPDRGSALARRWGGSPDKG